MAQPCFHASVEGAQHGAKNLSDFLAYAKKSGAAGAQPSNYMLQAEGSGASVPDHGDIYATALDLSGINPKGKGRNDRPALTYIKKG